MACVYCRDAENFDSLSVQSTMAETTPRQISGDKTNTSVAHSVPVDVPASPISKSPLPNQTDHTEDSGICGSGTLFKNI